MFQAFLPEYEKFKASIADLDRRLASIVCQGFDDCSGLEAGFKVQLGFLFDPDWYQMQFVILCIIRVIRWTLYC